MSLRQGVARVITVLNDLSIPYMVVGSFSTNFYGIPRSTQDADFVAELAPDDFLRLAGRLGDDFRPDPQMGFETVTGTSRYLLLGPRSFVFEFFLLSEDLHDRARFARRRKVVLEGCETWIPTAEDAIVTKLRWAGHAGREKDLEDVRNVIRVRGAQLDWPYVEQWCQQHGTLSLLEKVRAAAADEPA